MEAEQVEEKVSEQMTSRELNEKVQTLQSVPHNFAQMKNPEKKPIMSEAEQRILTGIRNGDYREIIHGVLEAGKDLSEEFKAELGKLRKQF